MRAAGAVLTGGALNVAVVRNGPLPFAEGCAWNCPVLLALVCGKLGDDGCGGGGGMVPDGPDPATCGAFGVWGG